MALVRAGAEVRASLQPAFPAQTIYDEVNYPYRKKNPWPTSNQCDVDSPDVDTRAAGGGGSLDPKAGRQRLLDLGLKVKIK